MIFPPLLFAWGKVEGELKFRFFEDLTRSTTLPLVLFQTPVKSYWYDVETICRIAKLEKNQILLPKMFWLPTHMRVSPGNDEASDRP